MVLLVLLFRHDDNCEMELFATGLQLQSTPVQFDLNLIQPIKIKIYRRNPLPTSLIIYPQNEEVITIFKLIRYFKIEGCEPSKMIPYFHSI